MNILCMLLSLLGVSKNTLCKQSRSLTVIVKGKDLFGRSYLLQETLVRRSGDDTVRVKIPTRRNPYNYPTEHITFQEMLGKIPSHLLQKFLKEFLEATKSQPLDLYFELLLPKHQVPGETILWFYQNLLNQDQRAKVIAGVYDYNPPSDVRPAFLSPVTGAVT